MYYNVYPPNVEISAEGGKDDVDDENQINRDPRGNYYNK